jgi:hypothetical protein
MFIWLRSLVSASAIVELHTSLLRVRDISGQKQFEFESTLSIDGAQRVVAIGRPIPATAVRTYAPFESKAALAADSQVARLILSFAYSKLGQVKWLNPAPRIVLHIGQDSENGAQEIDDRTLIDLSKSAGARITVIHRGGRLTDGEAERILDAA